MNTLEKRLREMAQAWHGDEEESLESVLARASAIGAEIEREECANVAQEKAHRHEGRAIACDEDPDCNLDYEAQLHRKFAAVSRQIEALIRARGK